jgi:hypothetical protein
MGWGLRFVTAEFAYGIVWPIPLRQIIGRENLFVEQRPYKKNLHLGSALALQIGRILSLQKDPSN